MLRTYLEENFIILKAISGFNNWFKINQAKKKYLKRESFFKSLFIYDGIIGFDDENAIVRTELG